MKKLFATMLLAVSLFAIYGIAAPEASEAATRQQIETAVEQTPSHMLFVAESDIVMVHEVLAEKGKTIVQEIKMKDQNGAFWFRIRFN